MIRFERTHDMELVRRVVCHPSVYPYITDDGSPSDSDYVPVDSEHVWYVSAFSDAGVFMGLLMLTPLNFICWDLHVCLLSDRGVRAFEILENFYRWVWDNAPCRRIVGSVPQWNGWAIWAVQESGMKQFGVNEKSFLRGGVLMDQVVFGISKGGG